MVRPSEELVRPRREEHVAVERPQLHTVPPLVGGKCRPFGALVEPPADVRESVCIRIVEIRHVLAHELAIDTATNVGDPPRLDPELDRSLDVAFERQKNVARRDDDTTVDPVVGAARDHHATGGPVIPPARGVDEAILLLHGVADPIGHVRACLVREAEDACLGEELRRDVRPPAQLGGREQAREEIDRLDAGEDARTGTLDLGQLLGEQEKQRLHHHVGALEHLDRGSIAFERGVTDSPDPDVAVTRGRRVGQAQVHDGGAETLTRHHERIGIIGPLVSLRQNDEALARTERTQPQLALAQVDERGLAHHRGTSVAMSEFLELESE